MEDDAIACLAIQRLQRSYADIATRNAWSEANQRFAFYEYIPLNFVVTIGRDDSARGRSYSLEVAEDRATGDWVEFSGVYEDEYAVFEDTWRFARRHYQTYGRRTGGRLTSFPLEMTPERGRSSQTRSGGNPCPPQS